MYIMKNLIPSNGVKLLSLFGIVGLVSGLFISKPNVIYSQQVMVTLCHAAGLDGTTHYETLTIAYPAAYGPAGHLNENGTPQAGHEDDYLGACTGDTTPTPTPTPTTDPECEQDCVTPTPTPTVTLDPTNTPTPTTVPYNPPSPNGDGKSDGRSDGKSDGKSSSPTGEVLGASTDSFAATGSAFDLIMNSLGMLGAISTAAGAILRKRLS